MTQDANDPRQVSHSTHVGVGEPLPAERAALADAAPTSALAAPPERVAVIVAHGMGQQAHFETLETVAEILRGAEARQHGAAPPITVRIVKLGAKEFPRAEIRMTGADGQPRDVHLYEAYWAPLTEGRITLRETMSFLVGSGFRGMRLAGFGWDFERYMFDRRIRFTVPKYAFLQFLAILLVIGALIAINALMIAVLGSRTITGHTGSWVSDALLADLTTDLGLGIATLVVGVLAALLIPRLFRGAVRDRGRDAQGEVSFFAVVVMAVAWLFMIAALASIVVTSLTMLWDTWRSVMGSGARLVDWPTVRAAFSGFETGDWKPLQWILLTLTWLTGLGVNYSARRFLLQYVGDVAAYISAHTVSKFAEVRNAIQACALDVAEAVYRQRPHGGPFDYPNVVVVGHSLGSVIAYDTLNALLVKDALGEPSLDVAERTRMLLTFGSPLDKTAFIFRAQRTHPTGAREALAAAKQPLILDYLNRPARWVNLYSPNDWISGSLEYYDDRDQEDHESQWVADEKDPEATTPLAAHNEYWHGRLLADRLYEGVTT